MPHKVEHRPVSTLLIALSQLKTTVLSVANNNAQLEHSARYLTIIAVPLNKINSCSFTQNKVINSHKLNISSYRIASRKYFL